MIAWWRRSQQALMACAVAACGLCLQARLQNPALAYVGSCRSDPVLILSNGYTLSIETRIADPVHDVQQVTYTVYIPRGVLLERVRSWGALKGVEFLSVASANTPHAYDVYITVATGASAVNTTTYVTLNAPGTTLQASSSGYDHQRVHVHVDA